MFFKYLLRGKIGDFFFSEGVHVVFFLFSDLFKVIFVTLYHGWITIKPTAIWEIYLFTFFQPSIQVDQNLRKGDLGVSKNNGTPKSSILIGFSIINHPFWGTPIFWKKTFVFFKISPLLIFTAQIVWRFDDDQTCVGGLVTIGFSKNHQRRRFERSERGGNF